VQPAVRYMEAGLLRRSLSKRSTDPRHSKEQSKARFKAWHLPLLILLVVAAFTLGISVAGALAGNPPQAAGTVSEVDSGPLTGPPPAQTAPSGIISEIDPAPLSGGPQTPEPCPGSYHYWVPRPGGPCNGCTVNVGDRFTLDLMVHSSSSALTSHQAYYTFTHTLLQNVRVNEPECNLATFLEPDNARFDAVLQNEVCNGLANCTFRGITVPPGSAAFASGALINPPTSESDFRVASMGLCAIAPGRAVLHWEFTPPTRVTQVGQDPYMRPVNPASCYRDYLIFVK
jgi:hypothetical protein